MSHPHCFSLTNFFALSIRYNQEQKIRERERDEMEMKVKEWEERNKDIMIPGIIFRILFPFLLSSLYVRLLNDSSWNKEGMHPWVHLILSVWYISIPVKIPAYEDCNGIIYVGYDWWTSFFCFQTHQHSYHSLPCPEWILPLFSLLSFTCHFINTEWISWGKDIANNQVILECIFIFYSDLFSSVQSFKYLSLCLLFRKETGRDDQGTNE